MTRFHKHIADQAYSNRIFPDVAKAMMAEANPLSHHRRTPRSLIEKLQRKLPNSSRLSHGRN